MLMGPTMSLDQAMYDFETVEGRLPIEAIDWALEHWDEAGPELLGIVSDYIDGEDPDYETVGIVLFAAYLCAEKRETDAFPVLCALMHDTEKCEASLDDGISEALPKILENTFDGQLDPLLAVIEDEEADDFIRTAGLEAMTRLSLTGRIPEFDVRGYFAGLYKTLQTQAGSYVWVAWSRAVSNLCIEELFDEARELFRNGFIDPMHSEVEFLEADIARTLADPARPPCFDEPHGRPFRTTKEELEGWYSFTPKYLEDRQRDLERPAQVGTGPTGYANSWSSFLEADDEDVEEPAVNPYRDVGRNDPCPCGSGKKFKKCCIGIT